MLKFFRHIRQRLVVENRFSRYLLYAIGEIVLVVIGILIAIALNGAYNDINDSKREIKYLNALKGDIQKIELELATNKKELQVVYTSCDSLLMAIHAPNVNFGDEQLSALTNWMISIPFITLDFQSYNNLKNTSDLSLIKSDSIKRSLSEIEFELNFLDVAYAWQDKQWTEINQIYVNKKMDMLGLSQYADPPIYRIEMKSIFENNWREILKDREFSNIVVNRKWSVIDVFRKQEVLQIALTKSKRLIEKELNTNQ